MERLRCHLEHRIECIRRETESDGDEHHRYGGKEQLIALDRLQPAEVHILAPECADEDSDDGVQHNQA